LMAGGMLFTSPSRKGGDVGKKEKGSWTVYAEIPCSFVGGEVRDLRKSSGRRKKASCPRSEKKDAEEDPAPQSESRKIL